MSIESSCRELIAAFIARELELNVADPAIIDITPEFTETLIGKDGYKFASNSIGINFGCKYFTGYWEFVKGQKLIENQFEAAEKIYAFDIFIANPDRRVDKQNMLTEGREILIFDHELAFSFVMDIIKNPKPWIFSTNDQSWIKAHYFYETLRQNEHNFDKFVDTFSILDDYFWQKTRSLIPLEWNSDQIDEIHKTLNLLVEHKQHFLENLYKTLS